MPSYQEKLVAEINERLDGLVVIGETWHARWIAHAICQNHVEGLVDGDDADFWRHAGYQTVREMVTKTINRRAGDKAHMGAVSRQIVLPGFERNHLQDYYLVIRDGDDVGLPVTSLTDQELMGKARRYRTMGATCYEHADEIDRFRQWRESRGLAAERALTHA